MGLALFPAISLLLFKLALQQEASPKVPFFDCEVRGQEPAWWAHRLSHHFPVMVPPSPDNTVPGADRRGRQAGQATCPSRVTEPFGRPVPGQAATDRDEACNFVGFEADVVGCSSRWGCDS